MADPTERYNALNVTEVRRKEFAYTWKIKNFELLHPGIGNTTNSEVNNDEGKPLWRVCLKPDGDHNSKSYIGVSVGFIKRTLKITQSPSSFYVYIIDKNGKECEMYKTTKPSVSACGGEIFVISKLVERNYLLDKKNELLTNGDLILRFKIYFTDEVIIIAKSNYNDLQGSMTILNPLENIFNNEKFSDVQIIVGDKVFYAYKGILANQSPVFAAMFDHNMKENLEHSVNITDVNHEVMHEVLRFTYGGNIVNIEPIVQDLLVAADKYEIEQLKIICEETLIKNLSIETMIDLSIFAVKYRAKKLKASALEFFKLNGKEIVQTPQYKRDFQNLLSLLPEIIEMFIS